MKAQRPRAWPGSRPRPPRPPRICLALPQSGCTKRSARAPAGRSWSFGMPAWRAWKSHLDRTGNRLALAMLALGLYVAASLLMLHSAGPRVLGGLPALALLGYAVALGLSIRLVRAIARSGRL